MLDGDDSLLTVPTWSTSPRMMPKGAAIRLQCHGELQELGAIIITVSAYRYIAITTLAIIAVFLEYLRQFLIDLLQTYRHSSVP